MAIVVEDGTIVANANSYLGASDIETILEQTPYLAAWTGADDDEKELFARAATKYLDRRFRFYGDTIDAAQKLQWPRTKNYDNLGFLIDRGVIPDQLKEATAIMAGFFAANPDEIADLFEGTSLVKSWSSEGLSVDFGTPTTKDGGEMNNEQILGPRYAEVELLLRSIGTRKDGTWIGANKQTDLSA